MDNHLGSELLERFTKNNQYLEALHEFDNELQNSSDRGLVLVCGSIIDHLLSEILKGFLIESDSVEKDLFNPSGILATFDSKIKMAYYLGLISKKEKLNITYMQRIRNKFAHQFVNISFENNDIINVCENFKIPKDGYVPRVIRLPDKKTGELTQLDLNPIKKDTPAKDRFIYVFNYLYYALGGRMVWEGIENREEYDKELTADNRILMQMQGLETTLNNFKNHIDEYKNVIFEMQDDLDKAKKVINNKEINNVTQKNQDKIKGIQDKIKKRQIRQEQLEKEYEVYSQFFNGELKNLRASYEVLKKSIEK